MHLPDPSNVRQLIGKRVVFKDDADHETCWHTQVGLNTGMIVKVGQSLAQKAELIGSTELLPAEVIAAEAEVLRVWVKADPCSAFPRGCEAAVEVDCLELLAPPSAPA